MKFLHLSVKRITLYCRITRTLLLNQLVAKPKTLDVLTQTSRAIRFPALSISVSFDDFSYTVAVALERFWVKKLEKENNIKSDVEMSMVLGFATDLFRGNVRVILQYRVSFNDCNFQHRLVYSRSGKKHE